MQATWRVQVPSDMIFAEGAKLSYPTHRHARYMYVHRHELEQQEAHTHSLRKHIGIYIHEQEQ